MTGAQRAELVTITKKLGPIYNKYDTRRQYTCDRSATASDAASEAMECFDDPFWKARGRERTRCSISRSWPMLDAGGYRRGGDGAALADRYSIGIYALDHGQNRAKSAKNP